MQDDKSDSNYKYVKSSRERSRERGMRPVTVWVHESERKQVQELAKKLNAARRKIDLEGRILRQRRPGL